MSVTNSGRRLRFFFVLIAATAALLTCLTSVAAATLTATPTRAFPIGTFSFGGYAPEFEGGAYDGTFWTVSGGAGGSTVSHLDDEGNNLGNGFSVATEYPLGIAYYGGRVFIPNASDFGRIVSFSTANGGNQLTSDVSTNERLGSNQVILRSYPNGLGTVGLGQDAKVATLDLTKSAGAHPWYPQAFHGNGVNKGYDPNGNAFESCDLDGEGSVVGEEDEECGKHGNEDVGNGSHPGFIYAIDTAPGLGGLYVADSEADRITHINTTASPGATIDFSFGQGPGSGAGQLDEPYSVVVQPGTGNVYVSEQQNRRISVFSPGGGYIASFGYGVLDGKDQMEVCGVEIGACQAGVAYQSDPRSYFTRLDFGSEDELLAYMPVTGQVQVFSVGDAAGSGGGSSPAPTPGPIPTGPSTGVPIGPAGKDVVRLGAKPLKVAKGKKTTLTATVNRGKECANRKVLFQSKTPQSWDNLGSSLPAGRGCAVSKRVKVTEKSVYRAVLIDSRNQATLGYSPKLTVKLK